MAPPRQHDDFSSVHVEEDESIYSSGGSSGMIVKSPTNTDTNTDEDLWTIHDVKYDLSSFVGKHPGGKIAILLGKGRDCSALFETYHPFTNAHRYALAQHACGKAYSAPADSASAPIKGIPSQKDADFFYHEICNRVRELLESKGIDVSDRRRLKATKLRTAHYTFCIFAALCSYVLYVRGNIYGPALFALSGWIQGSLGHDASHFAVSSRYQWVNWLGTYWGMGLISSPFIWMQQHTYAHHSFTNHYGKDPDLHHFYFLRVCPKRKWARKFILQAEIMYIWLWWSFIVFGEAVWLPIRAIVSGRLDCALEGVEGRVRSLRSLAPTIGHLFLYLMVVAIIPLYWGNEVFTWKYPIFYWLYSGVTFGLFTQVSHLNKDSFTNLESSEYEQGDGDYSWAKAQVFSCNNYELNSWVWFQLSLGLNYQLEHHLFPGINSEYLPLIAPTVRQVCEEHGTQYKCFDSIIDIFKALVEHFIILSSTGLQPAPKA